MAQDNFNGVNGTTLPAHNADWKQAQSSEPITLATIQNDTLQVLPFEDIRAYYDGSTEGVSEVILKADMLNNARCGPSVDTNATEEGYTAFFSVVSGANWTRMQLEKSGGFLNQVTNLTIPTNADHTLKLVRTDNGASKLLEVFIDGSATPTISYTDNSPLPNSFDGLSLENQSSGNVFLDDWKSTFASGPTITDINGGSVYPGETATLTGSTLGANGGTLTIGGVSQTVLSNDDTSATFVMIQNGLNYGSHDAVWTDTDLNESAPFSVPVIADPASLQYIDAVDPITELVNGEITSLFYGTNATTGAQLEADLVTDKGNTIQLNADGTFVIIGGGQVLETFSTRLWDQTDGTWSTREIQTINGSIVIGGMIEPMVEDMVKSMVRGM